MMNWFDRWFYRKARWCWKRAGYQYPELRLEQDLLDRRAEELYQDGNLTLCGDSPVIESDVHNLLDGLRIDVKKLNGGYVVTFRHPHQVNNKSSNYQEPEKNSHIITDDQDFYETLSKLMTIELILRA